MMSSGSQMSFKSLAELMDSMGHAVAITILSENKVIANLETAHDNVCFDTDWNMEDEISRWIDEGLEVWVSL